mgnify:CR=1 FL=1
MKFFQVLNPQIGNPMSKLTAFLISTLFAATSAFAQAPAAAPAAPAADSCEAKALSKDGKPLSGAAKNASIKKCEADKGGAPSCEAKALSKDGKPLSGAAKAASIKKCEADAKGAK